MQLCILIYYFKQNNNFNYLSIYLLGLDSLLPRESVIELEGVTELDHLGSEALGDRDTVDLSVLLSLVLLLTSGVDSVMALRLLRRPELSADIAHLLLELLEVSEALDINSKEEVPELDGDLLPVLHAGERLHEVAGLQARGEDLDDDAVPVPLVPRAVLACAAEGEAGGLARDEVLEDLGGVGDGLALVVDDPALGDGLALPVVHLDLASLDNRGCAVEAEGEGLVGGEGEDQGLVPIMGSTPKVGVIEGRALVPLRPMSPWRAAISE